LEPWRRYLAGGLSLVNLIAAGFVLSVLLGDEAAIQFGYPTGLIIAGTLAVVSSGGALGLLVYTAGAWWQRVLSIGDRLHYTLVAVAALYFVWYLNEVNLFLFWL
jgi:hypothetical protein